MTAATDDNDAAVENAVEDAVEDRGRKPSAATRIVTAAQEVYEFGRTPSGETYAVPLSGPRVVLLLRGGASLRAELSRRYFRATGTAPSQAALTDALGVIEGLAGQAERPQELHLRVADHGDGVVLDLADTKARAVEVTADEWRVVDESPVLFRRTALTGALPEPARGGTLADLWELLNVREADRGIVAAYLVAALLPGIPHPILAVTGEQGTGKSTAARAITAVLDPSPAQLRKAPRDVEQWTTAVAGSWMAALDNLSAVPEWLSDALCRASTGDGDVRRKLYSDGDLHVVAFRRVIVLNGIDLGGVRDDLADRLLPVALDRIPNRSRQLDADLARRWADAHPRVLGAVLDLAVRVLAAIRDGVHVEEPPRMADFAVVLAAVDKVLGTDGLGTYLASRRALAEDARDSDPVVAAVIATVREEWIGTVAELLGDITPTAAPGDRPPVLPKDWPRSGVAMRGVLTRRSPTLRRLGWTVEDAPPDAQRKVKRTRLVPPPGNDGAEQHHNEQEEVEAGRPERDAGNDPRDPRDTRASGSTAGQRPRCGAGVAAEVVQDPDDDTRTPADPREHPRPSAPAATSTDSAPTGVAGVAGVDPGAPLVEPSGSAPGCSICGQEFLFPEPGKTVCRRKECQAAAAQATTQTGS